MEVTCQHCNARLNIPDEKLPPNRRVAINCPKCKNKITIDTGGKETADLQTAEQTDIQQQEPPPFEENTLPEPPAEEEQYNHDDSALDIFEEGKKLALVMGQDDSQSETLKNVAESIGYQALKVENSREAVGKLRFHHFDLILLSDGFDGHGSPESPVLGYLNRQSMSVRRKMFLALIGDNFKTTDNMMAYSLSANLVVNVRDIDKLSGILKTSIAENEKFYKIFFDTLVEMGRA